MLMGGKTDYLVVVAVWMLSGTTTSKRSTPTPTPIGGKAGIGARRVPYFAVYYVRVWGLSRQRRWNKHSTVAIMMARMSSSSSRNLVLVRTSTACNVVVCVMCHGHGHGATYFRDGAVSLALRRRTDSSVKSLLT